MKRLLTVCCAFGLLTLASCERREVATAILTVGFSIQNSESVEGDWSADFTPMSEGTAHSVTPQQTPLDHTWASLQEIRVEMADGTAVEAEILDALLARIDAVISESTQDARLANQLASARQAKLAALSIGAGKFPDIYADRRDQFYRDVYQAEYNQQTAARASVKDFVEKYLAKRTIGQETSAALARHVTAYPECDVNVQLYKTTVERLANENKLGSAVEVGSMGVVLCESHADVDQLRQQLRQLQADNPDSPGTVMQFTSPTLRGTRFDLKSMRGKPVLVVFWASWCAACVEETPDIKDFYQRYRGDGLEVVGVSLDVDRQELADFVNENQLPWPQMFSNHPGNESWNNPIAKHYKVDSVPSAFLLDTDGTIVASHLTDSYDIEDAILDYLSR